MASKRKQKKILHMADQIVSMKENIDALSWGRVIEIAQVLQGDTEEETRRELGNELALIASTNLSMEAKLGIREQVHTGAYMASGIEELTESHLESSQNEGKHAAPKTKSTTEDVSEADAIRSCDRVGVPSRDPKEQEEWEEAFVNWFNAGEARMISFSGKEAKG